MIVLAAIVDDIPKGGDRATTSLPAVRRRRQTSGGQQALT